MTERRLDLAGLSTAVLEGGEGTPLVLLHGLGEHAPKWLRVIPALVRTRRVIAPDLPGHGVSDPPGEVSLVDWLDALIERTCTRPPDLVGQIIGGALGARFAIERPHRIRSLVLSDSLGLSPFQPAPAFGQALMTYVQHPDPDTHEGLWRQCTFDLDRLKSKMGQRWSHLEAYNLDRARAPGLAPAQRRILEQLGLEPISDDELERITVPTTLIWGRHDLATRLEVAEAVSARHRWPLHVIDGAADDPPIEQPEAFVAILERVLGA